MAEKEILWARVLREYLETFYIIDIHVLLIVEKVPLCMRLVVLVDFHAFLFYSLAVVLQDLLL